MKEKTSISLKLFAFVMSFLILVVSLPSYAFATLIQESSIKAEENGSEKTELIVLEEEKSLRDENIKHFKLSDGSTKAVVYSQAVHYLDENGDWIDIDNALTLNGSEYSSNNKTEIKFANKSGSNGLVSIKDGEYKIDFTPLNTNKVPVEIENPQQEGSRKFEDVSALNNLISKAIYSGVYEGVDLEYILIGNKIKENIVVNEKSDSYTYSFEIKLNKLKAELENNSIILCDYDTGARVYEIPAPYMQDSNGAYSQDVSYSLAQNSKWKYTLTVTANPDWINNEERVFPVRIDPTIVADEACEDTFLLTDNVDYSEDPYFLIGNFMNTANVPVFIKFNNLPNIPDGNILLDATLSMFIRNVNKSSDVDFVLAIYDVYSDWTNGVTYENHIDRLTPPANSNTSNNTTSSGDSSQPSVSITEMGTYHWSITSLFNKWQTGKLVNNGLCVKAKDLPSDAMASASISSSDNTENYMAPRLEITYLNQIGVEDYYGCLTTTLGETGLSYINTYNSSLTYINHLTGITNQSLTYDISMIYNSIEKTWMPSFAESITLFDYNIVNNSSESTDSPIDNAYVWKDMDGTSHWFVPYLQKNLWGEYVPYEVDENGDLCESLDPSVFYPEDDIDYVLIKTENDELILRDYNGNQKLFDKEGKLSRICDSQGNVLHINNYLGNSNTESIYIKNSANEVVFLAKMSYNANGTLQCIYNEQSQKKINLIWSNNRISSISYHNYGVEEEYKKINFAYYDEGKISSIFDSSTNQLIKYYIDTKNTETNDDDEKIVEKLSLNGNQEQTIKKYVVGYSFYSDLGTDFVSNSNDAMTTFTFDDRGRKLSVTTDNTISYTYSQSILPDSSYYDITYNENIQNQGFNLVKYNMGTGERDYLSAVEQSPIFDFSNITTSESAIAIGNSENIICKIRSYYEEVDWHLESTGFLVGPNILLLSAHGILADATNDGIYNHDFPVTIEVTPEFNFRNVIEGEEPVAFEVRELYVQREYYYLGAEDYFERHQYDWAVCVLEENIGNDFGWANLVVPNEDIIGQISLLRGYVGANETLSSSIGRILEFQGEKIKLSNAARNGISGGPVFLNNEDYLVFGILVAGDSDGISYAKRIDNLIFTLVDNLNSTE